jgi:alpha-tubulin suppressor-like RCC1 family protein
MNEKKPTPGEVVFGPTTPTPVAPGLKFRSLSVGAEVACGLTDDGAAYCWGDHLHGALGDGRMRDPDNPNDRPRMTPAPVLGGRTFQTVVVGTWSACGLMAEGVAYCWGLNDYGQLGDGTTQDRAEPVLVRAAP